MSNKSPANIAASSPPVPALISMIAFFESSGSLGTSFILIASARDAKSSGDTILAESYFQHAEHYVRILIENGKFEINPSNNSKKDGAQKVEQEKKTDNQSNDGVEKVSKENGLDSIETEKISKNEDLESSAEEISQN